MLEVRLGKAMHGGTPVARCFDSRYRRVGRNRSGAGIQHDRESGEQCPVAAAIQDSGWHSEVSFARDASQCEEVGRHVGCFAMNSSKSQT